MAKWKNKRKKKKARDTQPKESAGRGYAFIGVFVALLIAVALIVVVREVWTPRVAEVAVPKLSPLAAKGEVAFREHCAECHGANAGGSDRGPPLVHRVYQPNHHADVSFVNAIKVGARSHHWNFGHMPPQPAVEAEAIPAIIRFVRELQKANGIF